ncbi:hypothetical protein [Aurantiacibacter poecillastricola]|uniref:hypothetical protein n=1 Tax=Aurantiacibacter poecillastricola TaxID=3064385 RepID=UPI00273FFCA9|nr:hypothetical protein [Aurantiacibacter sp. 219JJ12-13]MDP5262468.1 hypothetical protein [Aurantiacibacter sp. 219JJ12-13]
MRMIFALSAALLIAGCGSSEDGTFETAEGDTVDYQANDSSGDTEYRITGEDGEELVINTGSGTEVDLPDGYNVYPGATVTGTTTISQADGQGTMVMMESDDSPEELAEYYRNQAEAAGITIQMEMSSNGTRMIGGEDEAGGTFSFNASPSGTGTMGQLVVGRDTN